MARVAVTISLSDDERAELEALSRRRKTSQGLARRARIVLAAAEGLENKEIAVRLEASADTVGKWRRRYAAEGLDGLYDEPRPGAPRQIGDDAIAEVVRLTLEETPPDATHWSLRGSMARAAATRPRPFIASGGPSACSRIARRPSSCRAIPSSWRRSATSSVCIWRRRIVPWFSVSTKRARSRPWTVPSPSCRCAPGRRSGAATTTSATARPLSSRPSTSPRERSSANVSRAIGPESSANSSVEANVSLVISRHGQLRDPQDQGDPRLVRPAALAGPFHTHQRLLAEPGRALVRAPDRQADQARRPSLHQGVGAHHPRLHRHDKPEAPKPFKWTKSADAPSSAPSSASASEQSKSLNSRRKSCELRNRDTRYKQ